MNNTPDEITLPHAFQPRPYQLKFLNAWDSGIKRMFIVWHRRSGKDKTVIANLPKRMMERVGTYFYALPTYSQAKKIIWTGADKDGFKFLDHFPKELIKNVNQQDMIIELVNGSILQLIGADNIDRIVGTNPIGVVFSEYSLMKSDVWNLISPILLENGGWAIFIMTPRGTNHAWDLMQKIKHDPSWFLQVLTVDDTKALSKEQLEQAQKEMPQDLFQQEYYCFTPDTDIITINGIKKINQIKSGDFVLTHSNRFRKVLGVIERDYEGELNIIDTYGSNRPLKLTPEHRVRITNDGVNYQWKEAKEITNKDRLTFPKILPRNNKIIDKALATLIAWFIVEGSARKSQVTFTLNENEIEYAEEIKTCLNLVNNGTIHEIVKDGSRQIINNNANLVEFLISQCGSGALNKKIPFQIISGYEQLVYDILIKGDGHFGKDKDSFGTISETLGYQIQLLANMLGYTSGITFGKNEGVAYIQGRKVNIHNSIQVRIQKTKIKSGAKLKYHKYSVSSSLKSNIKENYIGKVYNLEVEIDNSYTANGRIVHNCKFLDNGLGFFRRVDENTYKVEEYQPKDLAMYQIGVDLAKYNDFTVISPFNLNDFHVLKQDAFNQMDYNLQKARIENAYLKHNKGRIVIDSTGCLVDNQKIFTARGLIPISEVKDGELVLTADNSYQKIKNITSKEEVTEVYSITPFYQIESIQTSFTHLFKTPGNYKKAGDLNVGDLLEIEMKMPDVKYDYKKEIFKFKPFKLYHPKNDLFKDMKFYNNPLFWRIVGYYFAEGYVRRSNGMKQLQFAFHINEDEYHKDIELFGELIGRKMSKRIRKDVQCAELSISCGWLVDWFATFGKAVTKKFPYWFDNLPDEFKIEIIKGYWRGDGDRTTFKRKGQNSNKSMFRICSASEDLIATMQRWMLHFGIISSLTISKRLPNNKYVLNISSAESKLFAELINEEKFDDKRILPSKGKKNGNFLYVPIKEIKTEKRLATLWEFETENHSCKVKGATLHNVGEPVFDDLNARGMNITPFRFNKSSRTDLLKNLQILLEQDKIKIPNDEVLIDELKSMTYELNEQGGTKICVPDGKHDDRIMSLALAVWEIPQNPIHVNAYTNSYQTKGVDSYYPEFGTGF